MPEWCPRKHNYKTDGNDEDNPGYKNVIHLREKYWKGLKLK